MRHFHRFRLFGIAGAAFALALASVPARAQDAEDLKRGVARISMINGDVSVRRGSNEWVAGVVNAPLLTDDQVATGPNSRAEVQFDASNLLRLGANAEMRLSQLEYGRYQMELTRGLMTYRMLRTTDGNIEIDTPSLSVRPTRQGSFRIAVNENGETEVTARYGDVEVFNPKGSQWVRSGQTLIARGTSGDAEFQVIAAGGLDDWDRWCDTRDRNITQSVSARYVGPGVYGTEDMDAYGSWTSVPEYGYVWRPVVSADWAPYQAGRWGWDDWYGWNWISYDPWGWAPYHYGRWFHHDRWGWCWYPGVMTARHYWSPALVGFFGFGGGGISVGFGFGHVGWVPLAPFEVYHPWWGRGHGGFNRQMNITNVNVVNVYRNAGYRNAISAVTANDFRDGRFHSVSRFDGRQVGSVGAIHGQMPFAGGKANMRFTDRQASFVPRATANNRVYTHQAPSPAQRGGFGGSAMPARAQSQTPGDSGGWRRFGAPAAQGQGNSPSRNGFGASGSMSRNDRPANASQPAQSNVAPRAGSQGGWQRFGAPSQNQNLQPRSQQPVGVGNSAVHERPNYGTPGGQSYGSQRSTAPSYGGQSYGGQRQAPPSYGGQSYGGQRQAPPSYGGQNYGGSRPSAPSYSAPRQSAPSYSAPRQSAPSYSAPRATAPAYSAPRSSGPSGGGGGGSSRGGSSGGGHGGRR